MILQTAYLVGNSLLYLIVGFWCASAPSSTAKSIGFELIGPQGTAEYIAVYGGLEVALGIFFGLAAIYSPFRHAGLVFGATLYGGLVIFRMFAMVSKSSDIGNGWYFFGLEILMLLVAIYLLVTSKIPSQS